MFSYFEKLRKAPTEERKRVATTYTVVFVAIIFVIWLVSLGFRFDFFDSKGAAKQAPNVDNSAIIPPY